MCLSYLTRLHSNDSIVVCGVVRCSLLKQSEVRYELFKDTEKNFVFDIHLCARLCVVTIKVPMKDQSDMSNTLCRHAGVGLELSIYYV